MATMSTMTAAVTVGHGGPDQIEVRHDWPRPHAGPGQALVRVKAAAVNNTDIWSRQGAYGTTDDPEAIVGWKGVPLDFPRIQGIDIAGEVAAVGSDVDPAWLGKRVIVDPAADYDGEFPSRIIGSEVDGGFAQYHVSAERQLHDVTASPLTDAQLSCLPTAYGTALGMLNRAACSAGERVLVTGASGGVGMASVQLLLSRDCEVIARTSEARREQIADLGVAEVSVRGIDDISLLRHVDVVVDVVGGDEFGLIIDRLRDGGRIVTAGAIAGPVVQFDIRRLYLHQRTLIGSTMHTPADFAELATIAVTGSVEPLVAVTYPLIDIRAAQARFVAGDFVGKLVLEPWGHPRPPGRGGC
jgi:NADPH:quinone reductase-like Zn-dependent oxidoreductase